MGLADFLTELGAGLASWLPILAETLVETFMALFFTQTTDGYALNTLGSVSLAFFIIGLGFRVLPAVLGWLRTKWTARKGRKRKAR